MCLSGVPIANGRDSLWLQLGCQVNGNTGTIGTLIRRRRYEANADANPRNPKEDVATIIHYIIRGQGDDYRDQGPGQDQSRQISQVPKERSKRSTLNPQHSSFKHQTSILTCSSVQFLLEFTRIQARPSPADTSSKSRIDPLRSNPPTPPSAPSASSAFKSATSISCVVSSVILRVPHHLELRPACFQAR